MKKGVEGRDLMLTYKCIDGTVYALCNLTAEERTFFDRVYCAYLDNLDWAALSRLVEGTENPAIRDTAGRVTRAVWDHPLYQAVRDLEDRAGLRQGKLACQPWHDLDHDPLADEWLPVSVAAREKGVTVPGLHKAIRRGAILSQRDAGRLLVSRNSLAAWTPNPVRQAARRKAVPA